MSNSSVKILDFALFGMIILSWLIEVILSRTWNKKYFTTGLLIFQIRIPVMPRHASIPSCSQLEAHFHSNWRRSLEFRQIAVYTYGFRDNLFGIRFAGHSQVMHGMLFFDIEDSEVVVKCFADWFTLWISVLVTAICIVAIFAHDPAPPPIMLVLGTPLVAILLFALVMGQFYWGQYSLFSNVATFASQAWSEGYLMDTTEA